MILHCCGDKVRRGLSAGAGCQTVAVRLKSWSAEPPKNSGRSKPLEYWTLDAFLTLKRS